MYVTKEIQNKLQKRKLDVHQRSIFREMMNTCDKFENSFLTKQESRLFNQKQKLQTQQQKNDLTISKQRKFRKTHFSLDSTQISTSPTNVYVKESKQMKQIKILRQKMMPKISKTNLQKKFKQIAYLRNMGYKTKNKKLQSFKNLTIEQDQENIINKSWDQFYHNKMFLTPTQTPNIECERILQSDEVNDEQIIKRKYSSRKTMKKSTYFLNSKISAFKLKKSQQSSLNSSFSPINSTFSPVNSTFNPNLSFDVQSDLNETSQISSLGTSFVNRLDDLTLIQFNKRNNNGERPTRISTRNRTFFKETIQSLSRTNNHSKTVPNTKRYPLSSGRNKEITQKLGLSKQKLSKENAFSLYKLIKGGYEADKNDIEGNHISLKKFREAKDNFLMLNNCFKKIKQPRYLVQQPQKVFNDGSFRSLVYLAEIENKISPASFRRVQDLNNVID